MGKTAMILMLLAHKNFVYNRNFSASKVPAFPVLTVTLLIHIKLSKLVNL
jgi:hypothetical protein